MPNAWDISESHMDFDERRIQQLSKILRYNTISNKEINHIEYIHFEKKTY